MGSVLSVMPSQASADVVALDVWQDAEGLVDAPDNVKAAWQEWRGKWRQVRREELKAVPPGKPVKTLLVPKLLAHWLACSEGRATWESAEVRQIFGAWRKEMIARGSNWFIVRALLADVPLGIVAASWGRSHVEIADLFAAETANLVKIVQKQRVRRKSRLAIEQSVQSLGYAAWRYHDRRVNPELVTEAELVDGLSLRALTRV